MATIDKQRYVKTYPSLRRTPDDIAVGDTIISESIVFVPSESISFETASLGDGYFVGNVNPTAWSSRSVLFDGIGDWAHTSGSSDIDDTGYNVRWSFGLWLFQGGSGPVLSSKTIFGRWLNNTGNVWRLHVRTNGEMTVYIATHPNDVGGTFAGLSGQVYDNNWHHWMVVYNGDGATNADRLQLYKDGSNQNITFTGTIPTTSSITPALTAFTVGRGASSQAFYVTSGAVDEVCHFNTALSASQVLDVYNSGIPIDLRTITTISGNLKRYYAMGEGHTGRTIPNLVSGSALTLMSGSGGGSGASGSIENRYSSEVPG